MRELPSSTRKKIEAALDRLIAALDLLDLDPDLEEDDPAEGTGDEEASLGATHAMNQNRAWRASIALGTDLEFDGDTCPDADKEPDADWEPWLAGYPNDGGQDLELDPAEDEPSLGATVAMNQDHAWRAATVGWSWYVDAEFDGDTCADADREPGLGAPEFIGYGCNVDQTWWGYGCRDDREQDEDSEPSLGSLMRDAGQLGWAGGCSDDREDEHDGCEPDEGLESDPAEAGIGDEDGMLEQFPDVRGGLGQRVLP